MQLTRTSRTIALLGGGPVALALAELARAAGDEPVLGVRSPERVAATTDLPVATMSDAADGADIVIVAIPYRVVAEVLPSLRDSLEGAVVIDATNPLTEDYRPIMPDAPSAGEHIQRLLPDARVVKAFNTVFATVMHADRIQRDGAPATVFVAADDAAARAEVARFAGRLGFAPVEVGPLHHARHLEAMAHLNIGIAFGMQGGVDAAFVYHQAA